jgi:hypothetical protein
MLKLMSKGLILLALFCSFAISVHAEGNVQEISSQQTKDWPRLGHHYKIIGPATKKYNCIAWSLGITSRKEWPGYRLQDFDQLYGQHGFHRISKLDYRKQDGVEKVVLFGKKGEQGIRCTHAARQMSDGNWTNKLGALPLIKVPSPDLLAGPAYGSPVAVYVRKKSNHPNDSRVALRSKGLQQEISLKRLRQRAARSVRSTEIEWSESSWLPFSLFGTAPRRIQGSQAFSPQIFSSFPAGWSGFGKKTE